MNFRPGSNVADLALHKDGRIDCFEGVDRFFGLAHVLLEWQRGKIEDDGIKPGPGRYRAGNSEWRRPSVVERLRLKGADSANDFDNSE